MKTDRELLELAAKSIGKKGQVVETVRGLVFRVFPDNPIFEPVDYDWLHDAGDALRLAVKLRIFIKIHLEDESVAVTAQSIVDGCTELFGDDEMASTRRAIVRAAAEIGEAME